MCMPGKCYLQNKISKKLVNYLIVVTIEFNLTNVGKFHAKKYAQQDTNDSTKNIQLPELCRFRSRRLKK